MFRLFAIFIAAVSDILCEDIKRRLPDNVSDNVDDLLPGPKSGIKMTAVGTKKAKKTAKKKLKRLRRDEESHMPHDRSFGISGISQEIYEHKKFKRQLEIELSDIMEPAFNDLRSAIKDIENLEKELKYVRKCRYVQRKISQLNTALYKESCNEKDKLMKELEKLKDEAEELREEETELEENIWYFQKLCCFVFCFCILGMLNFLGRGLF